MPIVPRRTRMVTKPQRRVSFKLLKVFLIWRPRGSARPLVVGKPAALFVVVGDDEPRFRAVNTSWPIFLVLVKMGIENAMVVVVENVFNDLVEKREREDVEGCLFKETRQKSGEEHRLGRGCHGVGKTVMRKIIVWRNWRIGRAHV